MPSDKSVISWFKSAPWNAESLTVVVFGEPLNGDWVTCNTHRSQSFLDEMESGNSNDLIWFGRSENQNHCRVNAEFLKDLLEQVDARLQGRSAVLFDPRDNSFVPAY
jgi:hypothetical protein